MVPFTFLSARVRRNPSLTLVAVDHGGHLGFLSRRSPRFWLDGRCWTGRKAM